LDSVLTGKLQIIPSEERDVLKKSRKKVESSSYCFDCKTMERRRMTKILFQLLAGVNWEGCNLQRLWWVMLQRKRVQEGWREV
jgi:hypothetical protein